MSKTSLLVVSALTLVCGLIWVYSWHLTGLAAVLVIGTPIALGVLSAMYGAD